jgi:DNA polymerase
MMLAGTQIPVGLGVATVLPDMDFETYSEAGFVWVPPVELPASWKQGRGGQWSVSPAKTQLGSWTCLPNASQRRKGLPIVGAAVYATHPTTEVLSFVYDLHDGRGAHWWRPGVPNPQELFDHLNRGGLVEAHRSSFEHWIWNYVCTKRYGWPWLDAQQLRCSASKARAYALPGALDELGRVLQLKHQKDPAGKALLDKFSMPRNPTATDPRTRILPETDADGHALYAYNVRDIVAENEASTRIPDLSPSELEYWLVEQRINHRGVAIDTKALADCIRIVELALARYNDELRTITGGISVTETQKLTGWLAARGFFIESMKADSVEDALEDLRKRGVPGTDPVHRVLVIRALTASASVKKVYAIKHQLSPWGRLHDLFNYYGARTGRESGNDAQPQSLTKHGPPVRECSRCKHYYGARLHDVCAWCGATDVGTTREWGIEAALDALAVIATGSLAEVERVFVEALATVAGCLRPLFVAAPGLRFISSDYSSIEGVVIAMLAGETWRQEVFRTGGQIYIESASRAFHVSVAEMLRHKEETGIHHPLRDKGKRMELGLGFGGWIGALRSPQIDYPGTDDELKAAVLAWRAANLAIVEFWGGQGRFYYGWKPELFGLEGVAVLAVSNPGTPYRYRDITFVVRDDVLFCTLPSGRSLCYHRPRLEPHSKPNRRGVAITYEGWNSNPKEYALGWVRMEIYGGKFAENIVQAVARDILVHAIVNLEKASYAVVLHLHDEIVVEVSATFGSLEEVEQIMGKLPWWACGWPIFAKGGWIHVRFQKK